MQTSPQEKVELFISCRNLKNMDFFSKSDPQVRLYIKEHGAWKFLGQTETINDNLNPNFTVSFILDFTFEIQQLLKFEVVDIDGPSKFDFIGSLEIPLGKIMGTKKQTLIANLHGEGKKPAGKIIVRGETIGESQAIVRSQWKGIKLMNTDGWFGKSDPFLRFFKKREDEWLQVHETEVIMDNLNPVWKEFEIKEDKLCGGNRDQLIRIECWDWEKSGKPQYIGDCEVTLDMLALGETEFDLKNPKKKKKTGMLKLISFTIIEKYSFLEFIRGGEQLNVMVAVDFTGSNGHPDTQESLHTRILNGQLNQYQQAIISVSQILLNYDYDQRVAVYGFGGKPNFSSMSSNTVSHCFPCSGNPENVEVEGLRGVMGVYDYALHNVELSGPTHFSAVVEKAMESARAHKNAESDVYTILLILTDGEIHDMDQTIESIFGATRLPLSVIIVGIGYADFTNMETLDGDHGLYDRRGRKAERDLVQFVPFRNFNGDMMQLAKNVLAEVPDQLVEYMSLVGRKPRAPPMVDLDNLGSLTTLKREDSNESAVTPHWSNCQQTQGDSPSIPNLDRNQSLSTSTKTMDQSLAQKVLSKEVRGSKMGRGLPEKTQSTNHTWMMTHQNTGTMPSLNMADSVISRQNTLKPDNHNYSHLRNSNKHFTH